MLSHSYNILIDHGVRAPGHGKYAVYDLNYTVAVVVVVDV